MRADQQEKEMDGGGRWAGGKQGDKKMRTKSSIINASMTVWAGSVPPLVAAECMEMAKDLVRLYGGEVVLDRRTSYSRRILRANFLTQEDGKSFEREFGNVVAARQTGLIAGGLYQLMTYGT
ncbi:MAG TPA: hypothetical protein VMU78_01670 [Methylocella sp.]|jgi:hypothetical protein|nr:hypothetical protein [Methylocella sp.]